MPTEDGEIDLDRYEREPAGSAGAGPRRLAARHSLALRFVAAFVAGVVLGGVGVKVLRDSREQRERTVSLVAMPASTSGVSAGSPGLVRLQGQLALINAGSAPLTVHAATGQRPDARIRDTGQSRLIRPGGTVLIDVELRFDCSIPIENEPLPTRFSVKTDDNQDREVDYPVAVGESVWQRDAAQACQRLL
ncbi:hypothetical protein [Micromonospora sp. SL4-19]|uniref:hypothetical protein n=1 Tax=Micromonospora sp. SL4-19 TaxID=3399129 RepID=UPI003A4D9912